MPHTQTIPSLAILVEDPAIAAQLKPLEGPQCAIHVTPDPQASAAVLAGQQFDIPVIIAQRLLVNPPRAALVLTTEDFRTIGPEAALLRIRQHLTCHLAQHHPQALPAFNQLLDPESLARLLATCELARQSMERQVKSERRSFLAATDLSDEAVEQAMLAGVDHALGHLPRVHLPAGSILLQEDCPVQGLWIVLEGKVSLTRRGETREVLFHSKSTGRIVGLLALAQRQSAFFTCRAETDVQAIRVTWEQLDLAMQSEPTLSMHFVTVLVRSMSTRLRRIAELQLEVDELNGALSSERDHLAATLQKLEDAQARLVQSEKMATLGQLSAGVAHELNNPITAISRAADHVTGILATLFAPQAASRDLHEFIARAAATAPLPTAEIRRLRTTLGQSLHDDELAQRLVNIGITTHEQFNALLGPLPEALRPQKLQQLELAYQLGASLRSIRTCSDRVTAIVRSLKNYARPGNEAQPDVDLHEGIQDTLLLFKASLLYVRVETSFAQLPRLTCRPAELNQLWTNLISNAIEAMNGRGLLRIETAAPDPGHVQVRIVDSGPGIPAENIARVFEPNFTTKFGKSNFGLGMGLVICRQIVERHAGTIRIDSKPGRTSVAVTLPVLPPDVSNP